MHGSVTINHLTNVFETFMELAKIQAIQILPDISKAIRREPLLV